MSDLDQVTYPPEELPGRAPRLRIENPGELWRLHWEPDPNKPKPQKPGRWRFDAPNGEYPVTYANVERHHAFAEVYGDTDGPRVIAANQAERRISRATASRPLRLVDLGDAQTLARLNIDTRICTTIDYPRTQLWSQTIRRWLKDADGIRYPGRKAGREDNICLFLERCANALTWQLHGTIETQRELVMRACDMFQITALVYLQPTPGPDWP